MRHFFFYFLLYCTWTGRSGSWLIYSYTWTGSSGVFLISCSDTWIGSCGNFLIFCPVWYMNRKGWEFTNLRSCLISGKEVWGFLNSLFWHLDRKRWDFPNFLFWHLCRSVCATWTGRGGNLLISYLIHGQEGVGIYLVTILFDSWAGSGRIFKFPSLTSRQEAVGFS